MWKLGEMTDTSGADGGGSGTLRAKFDLAEGPSTPRPAAVQFVAEGVTASPVDFELAGSGYRVSLVKKRLVTGQLLFSSHSFVYLTR